FDVVLPQDIFDLRNMGVLSLDSILDMLQGLISDVVGEEFTAYGDSGSIEEPVWDKTADAAIDLLVENSPALVQALSDFTAVLNDSGNQAQRYYTLSGDSEATLLTQWQDSAGNEVWGFESDDGSDLNVVFTMAYQAVMDNGTQTRQSVRIGDELFGLSLWNLSGSEVWGRESMDKDGNVSLQTYELQGAGRTITSDSFDIQAYEEIIDAGTLNLWRVVADGSEIWGLNNAGTVSEYVLDEVSGLWSLAGSNYNTSELEQAWQIKSGALYEALPLIGKSVADLLGDASASAENIAIAIRDVIDEVRETADNVYDLVEDINVKLRELFHVDEAIDILSVIYEN
ncbi:MAG: hypothetical protein VXZ35_09860, partial [Pseudomonadota bacterium]|nr:hypothetical protein [Pseudomonadota bacterium]